MYWLIFCLVGCNEHNNNQQSKESTASEMKIIDSKPSQVTLPQCSVKIVGDSQVGNIIKFAKEDAKGNNWNLQYDYVVGSRIQLWENKYRSTNEDVTVVFLGTNDYGGNPNPSNLLSKIDNACIWVGPTNVYGNGARVNNLLKKTTYQCSYVDSLNIPLGDKIHPTYKGAQQWWNKVSVLIQQKCNSIHS